MVTANRSAQNGATCAFLSQWCGTKCGQTTRKLDLSQRLQTVATVAFFLGGWGGKEEYKENGFGNIQMGHT